MAREKKVIDASIAVKWFTNEPDSDKAIKLRDEHCTGNILLIAPELLFIEVLNALRYKGQSAETLSIANKALSDLQIHVEKLNTFLLEKAITTALKHDLSLYDAVYGALANIYGIPLITADKAMQKMPNAKILE